MSNVFNLYKVLDTKKYLRINFIKSIILRKYFANFYV